MDDEPFNPDYVEVDRVLDISESTDENGEVLWSLLLLWASSALLRLHKLYKTCTSVQMVTLYLVKWCSLPYEDCTWELKADIELSKIEEYERVASRTPNTNRVVSSARVLRYCFFSHATGPVFVRGVLLPPPSDIYSSFNCSPQGHVLVVLHTRTQSHTPCSCGQAKPLTVCLMLNRSS